MSQGEKVKKLYWISSRVLYTAVLAMGLASSAAPAHIPEQANPTGAVSAPRQESAKSETTSAPRDASEQKPQDSSAQQGKPENEPPPGQTEKKISPQEAQELFRSVDEILKFVSKDTTLPIREDVKRRLVNRDEVVAFIRKHMEED